MFALSVFGFHQKELTTIRPIGSLKICQKSFVGKEPQSPAR